MRKYTKDKERGWRQNDFLNIFTKRNKTPFEL